jgi:multiple sugar transport system permease protein
MSKTAIEQTTSKAVSRRVKGIGWPKALNRSFLHFLLIVLVIVFLLPFIFLIVNSLKTPPEVGAYPFRFLPKVLIWQNYVDAFTKLSSTVPYIAFVSRSLTLAIIFTIPMLISSSFIGYGFARLNAPGRNFLFILLLAMMMVPGLVTIIPQFVLYFRLGIYGTYWPWFLWGLVGNSFNIFLFRQFFANFPKELEDAAEIDGCNPLQTFFLIFLPNAGPVIATVAIFSFQWIWGDYFTQSLLLKSSDTSATLAMRVFNAYTDIRGNPILPLNYAGIILYIIPIIIVFFIAQKQIVRGIVTTGLK